MTARQRFVPVLAVTLAAAAGLGLIALAGGPDLAATQAAAPIRIGEAAPGWAIPNPRATAPAADAAIAQSPVSTGDAAIWSTPAEFAPPD